MLQVPSTLCNFQCQYCYLPLRNNFKKGNQACFLHSPEHVRKALSKERLGGTCYFNICAAGETLLAKNITKYIQELLKEGHYCEVVSNMTITPVLKEICTWDRKLLSHLEFKCSFHYLELKQRNLLDVFQNNVNMCWNAGASTNIELVPHDELIPYIDEIKDFSMKYFGALPQLTIARNDATNDIEKLTNLSEDEYERIWGQFDSTFWQFKMKIFGEKRTEFCYAGERLLDIDLATGYTSQCYCTKCSQNVFEDISHPISFIPFGKNCPYPHCFNGHFLLTLGCIPGFCDTTYAELRDRTRIDGTHWLQKEFYDFISQKADAENPRRSKFGESVNEYRIIAFKVSNKFYRLYRKLFIRSKKD